MTAHACLLPPEQVTVRVRRRYLPPIKAVHMPAHLASSVTVSAAPSPLMMARAKQWEHCPPEVFVG